MSPMFARKSLLMASGTLLTTAMGYVSLFFISRFMGPTPLGLIGFAFGFVGLFTFINELGFSTTHVKKISEGVNINRAVGALMVIKLVSTALLALFVVAAVFFWQQFMGGFESQLHETVVYIIALAVILDSFSSIAFFTFRGLKQSAKEVMPAFFGGVARMSSIILVAVLSGGVLALALCYALGALVQFLYAAFLFRRFPPARPGKALLKSYVRFSLPLAFIASFSLIVLNIDKVMVQLFWTAQDVGFYYGLQKVSNILGLFSAAVMALLMPTLSSLAAENDLAGIKRYTEKATRFISLVSLPLAGFILVFPRQVIDLLLGGQFIEAYPILIALVFVALISAFNRPFVAQLIGMGHPGSLAKFSLFYLALNIVLNLIFIPQQLYGVPLLGWGGLGAGIASVISLFSAAALFRWKAFSLTQTSFLGKPTVIHILATLIMGLALFAFGLFIEVSIFLLPLLFVGGLLIYWLVLLALKEFSKEDFNLLTEVINPKKMASYIYNELIRKTED